ncbi:MAG: hypothetical protein AAGD25_06670 [Cyanobacteria bacterium P01_F01_bin.150]
MSKKAEQHPKSLANLQPQPRQPLPVEQRRKPRNLSLSPGEWDAAIALAKRLELEMRGKPNASRAIGLLLQNIGFVMKYGGIMTVDANGKINVKKKES